MRTSLLLLALCISFAIVGCATKNPAYIPGNTNGIPAYVPDPRIAGYSNATVQVAGTVAPLNPYAGLTDWGLKLLFGAIGAVAAGIATAKSKNGTIDAMAAGVVKQGPTVAQSVLDHASTTNSFTAVASALNSNTGANQTNTGAPKSG